MVNNIIGNSIYEVATKATDVLMKQGTLVKRTGGNWNLSPNEEVLCRELHNVQLILKPHSENTHNKWYSHVNRGTVLETIELLLGDRHSYLHHLWKKVETQFLGADNLKPYTYGSRLTGLEGEINQLEYIIKELKRDNQSRHCVALIRRPIDLTNDYQPCSLSTHFQVDEHDRLEMTWVMRSNDIALGGLWRNLFMNTHLHEQIAYATGLELGNYYHYDFNLHGYERDWEKLFNLKNEVKPFKGEITEPELLANETKVLYRDILKRYFEENDSNVKLKDSYFNSLMNFITNQKLTLQSSTGIPEMEFLR